MASERSPDHEVAIIGAGLSGIGVGVALRRAGIENFVVLERAGDIGGTWRDNTYPGIGVDVPAQAYQFSFEPNPEWSRVFASGAEVKRYIDHCADAYGVRPHIRLDSDVRARDWDEERHVWRLDVGGKPLTARHVVSAIGAFVDPKPPEIAGLEDFKGKLIRSARWDHDYELNGRRVAVIGTGASAVQIVPELARVVERLDVYQRTATWVGPKFDPEISPRTQALLRRSRFAQNVLRRIATLVCDAIPLMVIHHGRLPFLAHGLARWHTDVWFRRQVPDEDLRRRLTPDYGFGCKRPCASNTYLRAFTRPNVELITEPIERVTATGVLTRDGREREVDAIVLATGFRMATDPENYRVRPVRGREGFDLARFYAEQRAAAYEGVTMPGLPNHFTIFGPYGFVGGTWHSLVEIASDHVVRVLREAARRGATAVEVRPEATERWTEFARHRLRRSLWQTNSCASANSYYFDQHGDTPYLRPTTTWQARRASRSFPLDDYEYRTLPG